MKVLVLGEYSGGKVKDSTLATLGAAAKFGGDVDLLLIGPDAAGATEDAKSIAGVSQVLVAADPALDHELAEAVAPLLARLMADHDVLLASSTTTGRNIAPRVAALLDVSQVSDIISVEGPDTFTRPIYAGNAIATVRSKDAKKVLTVRGTAFDKAERGGGSAAVEQVDAGVQNDRSQFVSMDASESERPELTSAKIIVSGGRALGSGAAFHQLIEPLADKLGAAVGASRAAVDAGYVPNDYQVGQTGKIVAPELYIAIGISGAIQHLAGMKDSKVIVAINKDEEAPIFQVADVGLVGDLFKLVPELTEKL
ncbi:MAG: Electron transfer flavoprotein, alpha subunit [uncultured Sphingomonas sp.]|uniref:Electron transfer flavoprotein subunit alpha n=1 Tax=uncultured Sphingomonas sp. TaxID=158754 RepID=A0A6J4S3K9_9SPHN|nr:FAD-binding protein [uncultured Sphingomonas sp.]CAA9488900.1 MAG: Electron transfer flavoprotein, alpha subunit [uncultured Sphingomonas sp.]